MGLCVPPRCVYGVVCTAVDEKRCARCSLQPPYAQVCFNLSCCFTVTSCNVVVVLNQFSPAQKLFSGHLCCDNHCLYTSTLSFSCATQGCVSGLRFLQLFSCRQHYVLGIFGASSEQRVPGTCCGMREGTHTELPAILLCSPPAACMSDSRGAVLGLPREHISCCCPGRASGSVFGQQSTTDDPLLHLLTTACC